MINRILSWINQEEENQEPLDLNIAASMLMVEVSMADHHWDETEEKKTLELLGKEFNLSDDERQEVLNAAKERVKESNDLFRFTNRINEAYSTKEKFDLVVMLWKIALADGRIDRYEDHIIRRIAELLYLHHSHFIQAKKSAMDDN